MWFKYVYDSSIDQCSSYEQSKGARGKLQEQLERVKTEINSKKQAKDIVLDIEEAAEKIIIFEEVTGV